jgi:hypothetical protein
MFLMGDDILGFTLDPVFVGGDEKGLQDAVPAINLELSINPNNQHINAIGEVLYTHANDKNLVYLLIIGKDRVRRSTLPTGMDTILIY